MSIRKPENFKTPKIIKKNFKIQKKENELTRTNKKTKLLG